MRMVWSGQTRRDQGMAASELRHHRRNPQMRLSRMREAHGRLMPANQSPAFWREEARRCILKAFHALESGLVSFGDRQRLHLIAAIDNFRYGHYETSCTSAQLVINPPTGDLPMLRFTQDKKLEDLRLEFDRLAGLHPQ